MVKRGLFSLFCSKPSLFEGVSAPRWGEFVTANHHLHLPSGCLCLNLLEAQKPLLEALLHIGLRQNPKRGFLLISRILGKHLPVQPRQMLESYRLLASQLSNATTTFIGMAETATALGQGVFEAYAERQPSDVRYISTTRYPLDFPTLTFEETHSHAPSHYLHLTPENKAFFLKTTRLVLVDDEISTGQTLLRLARVFSQFAPKLEQIDLVSLTDFLGTQRQAVLAQFPVPTHSVALLKAGLEFVPDPKWRVCLPSSQPPLPHTAPHGLARVGCAPQGFVLPHINALANKIAAREKAVQVLGTGEFQFEPFLLALALEQLGIEVYFRATTRSPILEHGVIQQRLEFLDNYEQGLTNYLYNHLMLAHMPTIVCTETPNFGFLPPEIGMVYYCDFTKLPLKLVEA